MGLGGEIVGSSDEMPIPRPSSAEPLVKAVALSGDKDQAVPPCGAHRACLISRMFALTSKTRM